MEICLKEEWRGKSDCKQDESERMKNYEGRGLKFYMEVQ